MTSVAVGLNAFTPDASAAVFVDGHLRSFVEEERVSGEKHVRGWPKLALREALALAGCAEEQVGDAYYDFSPSVSARATPRVVWAALASDATVSRRIARVVEHRRATQRRADRVRHIREHLPAARVVAVEHHSAHAAYGFDSSPFREAAVMVLDSVGEVVATSISEGTSSGIRRVIDWDDTGSMPWLYAAVTRHLGWRGNDEEGTVMALASDGDPARFRELFQRAVNIRPTGAVRFDAKYIPLRVPGGVRSGQSALGAAMLAELPGHRAAEDSLDQVHADLAAALQETFEDATMSLARTARERTGQDKLVMAGGGALNCVAAAKIAESGIFESVYIPPAPGDSGAAIGAVLAGQAAVHRRPLQRSSAGAAWGLDATAPNIPDSVTRVATPAGLAAEVAQRLADGQIAGVCVDRSEAGPRALGHRSILASPFRAGVADVLNRRIKKREAFRPFAPIVLRDAYAEYFEPIGADLRYMGFAVRVREQHRDRLREVTHSNGRARVQTLDAGSGFVADVLERFAALTGHPLLINTSLNVKGMPLSGSVELAIACLESAQLDVLVVDDQLWRLDDAKAKSA